MIFHRMLAYFGGLTFGHPSESRLFGSGIGEGLVIHDWTRFEHDKADPAAARSLWSRLCRVSKPELSEGMSKYRLISRKALSLSHGAALS